MSDNVMPFPSPKPPEVKGDIDIRMGLASDGQAVVVFSQPLTVITFTREQAIVFAEHFLKNLERMP